MLNMKTVLNKINVDTRRQPLFLGEGLALQRYDQPKFPVFLDLYKKQLNFFWTPHEISLAKDLGDYKKLSANEQFVFTSNLSYQTMMDTVICRGVGNLMEYVSNPELEACLNAWQFFEQLHSYSYSYIINNVYPDPSEVFDGCLTNPEILSRAESAAKDYDLLKDCPADDVKGQLYLTLVSINILEAMRFYVSFVCAFAFAENKTMIGNADIIKLIRRDEAVHLTITQNLLNILTKNKDEGFQDTIKKYQPQAIQMFEDAVAEEKSWAKYLFKDGSIIGLNEEILGGYIEFLCGSRMKAIGMKPLYTTKNPIRGWITPWMDSGSVQSAPQETEVISYKISAAKNDLGSMDLEGFEL